MSLLLEALKKAEKAKEEAQRRARGEAPEPASAPADAKPVLTRDRLPDISGPLEIASDDLEIEPEAPAPSPPSAAPHAVPRARDEVRPREEARPREEPDAGRAAARKAFEAKFREPNPRMPFYITMGALGVFAVGTMGYFWYQLRPPPALVNANPPRQAEQQVAAAEIKPAAAASAAAPASAQPAIPGLPGAPEARPAEPKAAVAEPKPEPKPEAKAPAAPTAAAAPKPAAAPERPLLRPAPASRGTASGPGRPEPQQASVRRSAPQVHPSVNAGYAAFIGGDLATARTEYQQALRDDPANRDAHLGLAALEVRAGRYEAAEGLYLRVLQADPRDSQAQAALISLRAGRSDPLATESRVKSLLAADPGAHALNFTLGNQFAQQNRWAEAQQEYFKAYAAEPDNADFAYNLAVSLDHLRQAKPALEYYQRAIALAEKRGASFDLAAARARAAQLAR